MVGVGYGVVKALDAFSGNSGRRTVPLGREDDMPAGDNRFQQSMVSGHAGSGPSTITTGSAGLREKAHIKFDRYENVRYGGRLGLAQQFPRRADGVEDRLLRIEKRVEDLNEAVERMEPRRQVSEGEVVTQGELNAALEDFSRLLDADIERRFEVQDRSVQSLRTMIARTDELLERIIENIESTS